MKTQENIYFWAKTTEDGLPGISVMEHMLNVGHVAQLLAEQSPSLCKYLGLPPKTIAALAALHDLGKISPGFQQKCSAWLEHFGLTALARNNSWNISMETNHGRVTHAALQPMFMALGMKRKLAKLLATILGAHHGYIKDFPNDRGISCVTSESASSIDWDAERQQTLRDIIAHFDVEPELASLSISDSGLWWLAGLTSVADWIGSNEQFFPVDGSASYPKAIQAKKALQEIGFHPFALKSGLEFESIFPFRPNELQCQTASFITTPGVYIIEAPMGLGKTEAALWAAYGLMDTGQAAGLYFALPTQATSNRIHLRMNEFIAKIADKTTSSRLIHGNSWLMEDTTIPQVQATSSQDQADQDARISRDWFASTKRALLAPFGVGTIDQCLLGVVAAKHFFVRHFALAGKVVILDEIHSYDLYTGTLIQKLIEMLESLGCTIIILSATLTDQRKAELLEMVDDSLPETMNPAHVPYPQITGRVSKTLSVSDHITPLPDQHIQVSFVQAPAAMDQAITLAEQGGTVLWICNTVDNAQHVFHELSGQGQQSFPLGLLHARFPFNRREALEQEWMERFGKHGQRCGSILVATQVVEQSVDLDADLLITELAPTDMLLQRIGRLWRHPRSDRPASKPCVCIVEEDVSLDQLRSLSAKKIEQAFGPKAKVYAPYALLRSLEIWKRQDTIVIPGQIRALLEGTYTELDDEPEAWTELYGQWLAIDSAKKMNATQNSSRWIPALPDQEGIQTRLNEIPTIPLLLFTHLDASQGTLHDGETINLKTKDFSLSTARAIHRNLVKIPEYLFDHTNTAAHPILSMYLHGQFAVAVLDTEGSISAQGLKSGYRLVYTDALGLVVERFS